MKQKKEMLNCQSCKHWNNKQSELEYSNHYGICTCFKWKFTTTNDADCQILDRANRSDKHMGVNRFESQNNHVPIGVTEKSRYCFVTERKFGCIHHSENK
jgi:hypothetical protein